MDILKSCDWCIILFSKHSQWYSSKDRSLYWRTVLHSGALAHHLSLALGAPVNFEVSLLDERFRPMEKYTPLLLTLWNMTFQLIYLSLALWTDATDWRRRPLSGNDEAVRRLRDVVFSALVVPFSMVVSILFWLIYHIDRELVFPASLDAVVPSWFNHGAHTSIVLVVALELAVQPRPVPQDHTRNLRVCWFFSVLYAVLYYSVYLGAGYWLYPVFGSMTWWQICLFQLGMWTSMHLFYRAQWLVVDYFHAPTDAPDVLRIEDSDDGSRCLGNEAEAVKVEEAVENTRQVERDKCKCLEYCVCG